MLSLHNFIEFCHFAADLFLGRIMSGNPWDSATLEAFAFTFASTCFSGPQNELFKVIVCGVLFMVLYLRRFNYNYTRFDTRADCIHEFIHLCVGCLFQFLLSDLERIQIVGVSIVLFSAHILWQADTTTNQVGRHFLVGVVLVRLVWLWFEKQVYFFA